MACCSHGNWNACFEIRLSSQLIPISSIPVSFPFCDTILAFSMLVNYYIEVFTLKLSIQVGIPSKGASSVWSERTSPAHAPRVLKVCRPVPIWQTAVWTWSLLNTRHGCNTSDTWSDSRLKLIRLETNFSLPFPLRFGTSSWENFGCSQPTHFFGCVRELFVAQNLERRQ